MDSSKLISLGKLKKLLFIALLVGLAWGHNRLHMPLTPYISPGIQIGFNDSKTFFLSYQLTIGAGFKLGDHFEDTAPIFLGRTFGLRHYYQKEKPVVAYKYWIGAFGLLSYEKVHFDDKVEKQYGFFGVLPLPVFQILNY